MTEAQWLAATRVIPMSHGLGDRASERKVLLFKCACCRRVWDHLGEKDRGATAQAEISADDPVAVRELYLKYKPFRGADIAVPGGIRPGLVPVPTEISGLTPDQTSIRSRLDGRGGVSFSGLAWEVAALIAAASPEAVRNAARATEERAQAELVRDIFGNPFRPAAFAQEWGTGTARSLARQMYESRDFSAMSILADALQDAGCANEDVLSHCRVPGPHVRGCWVVDLVLGKV